MSDDVFSLSLLWYEKQEPVFKYAFTCQRTTVAVTSICKVASYEAPVNWIVGIPSWTVTALHYEGLFVGSLCVCERGQGSEGHLQKQITGLVSSKQDCDLLLVNVLCSAVKSRTGRWVECVQFHFYIYQILSNLFTHRSPPALNNCWIWFISREWSIISDCEYWEGVQPCWRLWRLNSSARENPELRHCPLPLFKSQNPISYPVQ